MVVLYGESAVVNVNSGSPQIAPEHSQYYFSLLTYKVQFFAALCPLCFFWFFFVFLVCLFVFQLGISVGSVHVRNMLRQ